MSENLSAKAFRLRRTVLDMVCSAGSGHIGGDYSVMEILVTLYNGVLRIDPKDPREPGRDRLIMSKGHSVEALYAVLADRGFYDVSLLGSYLKFGSPFIGHPHNTISGIEMNTGALGHGLPVGVGMALAAKADSRASRVYVILGDGELAEGSNWEAAMAAPHYHLDNLCAVVDRNRLQISGCTEDVMPLEDLSARFAAFGWNVIRVPDGNSIPQLQSAFALAAACGGRPTVLIACTVKGRGVSFMENQAAWHHRIPTEQERLAAAAELEQKEKEALAQ